MIRTNRLKVSAVLGTLILALALALAAVVLAVIANPAHAFAWITVTTTKDDNKTNGNCTLREAIIAANTDAQRDACPAGNGSDTINVPAGNYLLTNGSRGESEDDGETGDLDINDQSPLYILGAGADKTIINGYAWDRIFDVHSAAPDGWAQIHDLTIINGKRPTYDVNGELTDGSGGGGVRNGSDSTLWLVRVAVKNNTTETTCAGCGGGGGGIVNNYRGQLLLIKSTVSGNKDRGGWGGGILSGPYALLGEKDTYTGTTIVNSTISGNSSYDSYNGDGRGGGIDTESGLTRIWDSTITNNNTGPSTSSGSGVNSSDQTEVRSTIISKNANNDDVHNSKPPFTSPSFVSAGYNLIGGGNASSAFNAEGDQTGVTDPKIGPLQDNGGPTKTHALLSGSPALNAVPLNTNECGDGNSDDQRGVTRPQGEKCDIGAYEKKVRHR